MAEQPEVKTYVNDNGQTVAMDPNGSWKVYSPVSGKFGAFAKGPTTETLANAPAGVTPHEPVIVPASPTSDPAAVTQPQNTVTPLEAQLAAKNDALRIAADRIKVLDTSFFDACYNAAMFELEVIDLKAQLAARPAVASRWPRWPRALAVTLLIVAVGLIWFGAHFFAPTADQLVKTAQASLEVCNTERRAALGEAARATDNLTEAQAARKKAEDERDSVKKLNGQLTASNLKLTGDLEKALEAAKAKTAEVPPKKEEEPKPEAKPAVEKPKDESKATPSAADVVSPKGDAEKKKDESKPAAPTTMDLTALNCAKLQGTIWVPEINGCLVPHPSK